MDEDPGHAFPESGSRHRYLILPKVTCSLIIGELNVAFNSSEDPLFVFL